jgi:RNA polymerase sigma-70 factor (ECF subfamily)
MSQAPETRLSLLIRLKDRADQQAWQEFVEIYGPLIRRLAARQGLQAADADDLTQQVFAAVARSIDRWEVDPARARFRTWLQRIAHNLLVNMLTRGPRERGSGDTCVQELLELRPASEDAHLQFLRAQYQREVFRWAARRVRGEFQPATWQAFWETAVRGREISDVARELGKSIGSIYAARSRVIRRMQETIGQWQAEE